MDVILAGYNVDIDTLKEMQEKKVSSDKISPETLSAAYARISRDTRPVNELREAARNEVEKARKSNELIVFGLGHSSVAEHAVFNFDILGISRYAIEVLENFRLASFTEKSQRYITLDGDVVIPSEIKDENLKKEYLETIKKQNDFYFKSYEKIREHVFNTHKELAKDPKKKSLLEGWAKEDARYVTALSTEGQLGMTVNARTLELMVRRFSSSPLQEVRELGRKMYDSVKDIAPSLVKYTEATEFDLNAYKDLKEDYIKLDDVSEDSSFNDVELVHCDANSDNLLLASIIHKVSGKSFVDCEKMVLNMSDKQKIDMVKTSAKHMKFYDIMLREYEYPTFIFELSISASCFAQLKRHRMATITTQPYDIGLGVTMPVSMKEVGLEEEFKGIIEMTENTYEILKEEDKNIAPYILTNAHRRRVLIKVNAREMYHISRLREDSHAQWDIQDISHKMSELVRKQAPITGFMLCGKDKYMETYNKIYRKTAVKS